MIPHERCSERLLDERLSAIEKVRASLDARFAADWFESMWWSEWPTVAVVWLMAFAGMATVKLGWSPLESLIPLCLWVLAARVVPSTLLDRFPRQPVWARSVVALRDDELTVLRGLEQLSGGLNRLTMGAVPRNGKELWMLRERAILRQHLQEMVGRTRGVS